MGWIGELIYTRPWWLAGLVLCLPIVRYFLRSLVTLPPWQRRLSLAVRLLLLAVVLLALCGIERPLVSRAHFVVVAVDESASTRGRAAHEAQAFLTGASQSSGGHALASFPFAAAPGIPAWQGNHLPDSADRTHTDLAAAIRQARRMTHPAFVPHVVLLSDGNQTRGDAVAAAREAKIPVSTVPLPGMPEKEVCVVAVHTAAWVRSGEAFEVEVEIRSAQEEEGTLRIDAGQELVADTRVHVVRGENHARVNVTLAQEGWTELTARLEKFSDTLAENNRLATALYVAPPKRALLIEGQPRSAQRLAAALAALPLACDRVPPADMPDSAAALARYDLVTLVNVSAMQFPPGRMEALAQAVHDTGTGLLTFGGRQSFMPGGYNDTKLEEILPVSAYARPKNNRPTLALVLVIDRSESMAGPRITLAKEALRRAAGMLGPQDQLGILTFEDDSYWVSPFGPFDAKQAVLERIDTLKAEGRTNMYPAMDKAFLTLRDAKADVKHMIVLTDGMSHVDDFPGLARQIAAAGISVSMLGVGDEVAGPMLEDIARIGHGHFYMCDDAKAVPRIFAQETINASQQGITEEEFAPQAAAALTNFGGVDLAQLPKLRGYAETRLKPWARAVLTAETGDPLLAGGRYGAGTSIAFTSTLDRRWAAFWMEWSQLDPFLQQLARRTLRGGPPPGVPDEEQRRKRIPPAYADEFRCLPTNEALLKDIAEASGGRYNPQPAEIFHIGEETRPRTFRYWPLLLLAALPLLLLDVIIRRVHFRRERIEE